MTMVEHKTEEWYRGAQSSMNHSPDRQDGLGVGTWFLHTDATIPNSPGFLTTYNTGRSGGESGLL